MDEQPILPSTTTDIWHTEAKIAAVNYPTWSMGGSGGWYPIINEPFTGAWQRNLESRVETFATFHAVYACITLIASDISKVRIRLVQQDQNSIWSEVTTPNPFSPVLTKPNRYQNRISFFEQWIISKLVHGNTYVLKERDARGIVTDLYILDPCRTKPLVAEDGAVYYQLAKDNLAGVAEDSIVIPASEIIHDTMVPLFHPLCGVSPLTACGLAALQGMNIQQNSVQFFGNASQPGGFITAPGAIPGPIAERIKAAWEQNYSGKNAGRLAVLGDGLTYAASTVNAVDAQLIDQLKWSAETVCGVFRVPPHKVGIGPPPNYNNIEALENAYYTSCLQQHFEKIELCLDEGLNLVNTPGKTYGTEFDLDDLLRMDSSTKVKAVGDAIQAGFMAPNEGRRRFDLAPVTGGDTPYLQQQYWPIETLASRPAPIPPQPPSPADSQPPQSETPGAKDALDALVLMRGLGRQRYASYPTS